MSHCALFSLTGGLGNLDREINGRKPHNSYKAVVAVFYEPFQGQAGIRVHLWFIAKFVGRTIRRTEPREMC